ncbi:MAG: hypothetical protein JWL77_4832 [Chthonomonadaceae bacterium]|nr:hypothetical protein [Chthonomonadaceae bacterium]
MRRAALLFVAISLAGGITGGAKADGTIILRNASDFQNKIDGTNITGAGNSNQTADPQQTASNSALSTAFPNASGTIAQSNVVANTQINGLLSYVPSTHGGQNVSGWTYGYHIDPDLTNFTVNLQLYLPEVGVYQSTAGINMVSIALTSVSMDSSNQPVYSTRAWGFDNDVTPGILNPDPTTHLQDFSFAALTGAGAGGSNFFAQDSGFDLANVWYVSIGYRGTVDASFPPTPIGGNDLWMGTESLVVVSDALTPAATPEPTSAAFLACGLLSAGLLRFTLRKRSRRQK